MTMERRSFLTAMAVATLPRHPYAQPANGSPGTLIIALAENYSAATAEAIYTRLTAQVVRGLVPGERIIVVNAPRQQRITIIEPVMDPATRRSHRLLAAAYDRQLAPVREYLRQAQNATPQPQGTPASTLGMTGLSDYLRLLTAGDGQGISVMLIGAAQHADARQPSTAMLAGHFPNDAHLLASSLESPYGTADRRGALNQMQLHFCTLDEPQTWIRAEHRHQVERFWTLWAAQQGGGLATFSDDLATCWDRAIARQANGARAFTIAAQPGQREMLRIPLDLIAPPVLSSDVAAALAAMPVSPQDRGRLEAGIRAGRIRLFSLTAWDTADEDGDSIYVIGEGVRIEHVLRRAPQDIIVPVSTAGQLQIQGGRDGAGGGITLALRTPFGSINVPPLVPGQLITIPLQAR